MATPLLAGYVVYHVFHSVSLRVVRVRACIAACCTSGIKHLRAALAVISYTHTVLYCVYTNTACVLLTVVFRLCIDVSFVCV